MKLSIIVCIYNVEKYIEKCLRSLVLQDLGVEEYEIILINDGSPDLSALIVKPYLNRTNISYYEQENQGLAASRNFGLEVAKGEYILFVDPDDYIEENSIKKIILKAAELNVDIMYLNMVGVDEAGSITRLYPPCGADSIVLRGALHARRPFPATLYARRAIADIRHIPQISRAQDSVFNAMVQSGSERVSYFPEPYYYYLQRDDSSKMNYRSEKVFESCLIAITSLDSFCRARFPDPAPEQKLFFEQIIKIFVERILQWSIMPDVNMNRLNRTRKLLGQLGYNYLWSDFSSEYKLLNINSTLFYAYHRSYRLKKLFMQWF